jgi:hypothetical protein
MNRSGGVMVSIVVFSWVSGFLNQYNETIVESGVKHHNPTLQGLPYYIIFIMCI